MLLNCEARKDSWESTGLQWDQISHPKENQLWIFIGRTDAETEAPILWPPDAKSWLTGKDSDAGKDWRQREKRATEDEVVGWHHWLNGYGIEQTLGDTERQGSLACCRPRGCRVGHDLATKQQCKICIGNNKLCFNCCGSPEWKTTTISEDALGGDDVEQNQLHRKNKLPDRCSICLSICHPLHATISGLTLQTGGIQRDCHSPSGFLNTVKHPGGKKQRKKKKQEESLSLSH